MVTKAINLKQLIAKGEGETLDFKQTIKEAQKIAKILSAFANTKGGILLIGIKDNGSPARINPDEEKHMLDVASGFYCKPEIKIHFSQQVYLQKNILIAEIPQSEEKPHFAKGADGKWWAYIRVHDQCLLASKVMLDVMQSNTKQETNIISYGVPERLLLKHLEVEPRITLKQFCKLANIGRWRAQKILVNMVRMGLIKVISTEKTDYYSL